MCGKHWALLDFTICVYCLEGKECGQRECGLGRHTKKT